MSSSLQESSEWSPGNPIEFQDVSIASCMRGLTSGMEIFVAKFPGRRTADLLLGRSATSHNFGVKFVSRDGQNTGHQTPS